MITLKRLDEAVVKYDGLGAFLAECRSTILSVTSTARKNTELAMRLQAALDNTLDRLAREKAKVEELTATAKALHWRIGEADAEAVEAAREFKIVDEACDFWKDQATILGYEE